MIPRRKFIKDLSFTAAASIAAPSLLAGCKKDLFPGDFKGKVVVIGAGAAGLYASWLLNRQGIEVEIVEASGQYGGRMRSLDTFSDFPIELGAEEVHGQRSVLYDLVRSTNAEFIQGELTDHYYLDGAVLEEAAAEEDADVKAARSFIETAEDYQGDDISVAQHSASEGIPSRVNHLLNAWMGNEYGTSNSRMGMKGLAEAEKLWSAGNKNFLLRNRSMLSVFGERFAAVTGKIRLNTPITRIDYSGSKVVLYDLGNNLIGADKVILTVPLPVLKDGDILFTPALPDARLSAMHRIGMDAGLKIILKFGNRFWGSATGSIYGNGLAPEFWVTGEGGRSTANNILTAFVMGENAEALSAQGSGAVNTVLGELDGLYGAGSASGAYADYIMMDWKKAPYIKGAYSYPAVGEAGAREILAAPLENKLFFAGEATHTHGHFGTVHGAMETGLRAVQEVLGKQ